MRVFKCINQGRATSVCHSPTCQKNAFLCRTCRREQCFMAHNHIQDRSHIQSLDQIQKILQQTLSKRQIPCFEIYQKIKKQLFKFTTMIEGQYAELNNYIANLYDIPEDILNTKNNFQEGRSELISSKQMNNLIEFCKSRKQLPDLSIRDYIELQGKINTIRQLQKTISQKFKNLYQIPKKKQKRPVTLNMCPYNQAHWKIDNQKNQYINLTPKNLPLISSQLLVKGIFIVQLQANVTSNIHFGVTKYNSLFKLNGPNNQDFPLQTEDTYSYHANIYGRIYKQMQNISQIFENILKGRNKQGKTLLKLEIDTINSNLTWFNGQQKQCVLSDIQITQGVYVVISIDDKGEIKMK